MLWIFGFWHINICIASYNYVETLCSFGYGLYCSFARSEDDLLICANIIFAVFWSTVVGCMVDIIMPS